MANLDNRPQNGLGGTSYMYQMGTSPNTRTAISSKVRVLTPHYGSNQTTHQMGVMAEFSRDESGGVEEVRGIGFGNQIAELVPTPIAAATGNFTRALLYLCNLWQATGYASGVDGPVRSLRHHRWPFDVEEQLVFSSLVDADLGKPNVGVNGQAGRFDGGVKSITYPEVTNDNGPIGSGSSISSPGGARGHSAVITMCEACWFTSANRSYSKDAGMISEGGAFSITDMHDFASLYGEFLASGNDPTIGQLGSIRFTETLNLLAGGATSFSFAQAGGGVTGGGTINPLAT